MSNPKFWLTICQLAEAYGECGLTSDERMQQAVAEFAGMSPSVQRQIVECTLRLSLELPDLYVAIAAEANSEQDWEHLAVELKQEESFAVVRAKHRAAGWEYESASGPPGSLSVTLLFRRRAARRNDAAG